MKKLIWSKIAIGLFFLNFVLTFFSIILDVTELRLIFDVLVVPLLLVIYLLSAVKINKLYVVALLFAFLGDLFMTYSSDMFFIYGLGSFLIMHLIYLVIITKDVYFYKTKNLLLAVLPFAIVLTVVIFFTYDNISEFLWPIIVYGLVLCVFGAFSFYHYFMKKTLTSLLLFLGAFIFIISNSMSAIEKFRLENKDLWLAIMSTYVMAQYLICSYMIRKTKAAEVPKI